MSRMNDVQSAFEVSKMNDVQSYAVSRMDDV